MLAAVVLAVVVLAVVVLAAVVLVCGDKNDLRLLVVLSVLPRLPFSLASGSTGLGDGERGVNPNHFRSLPLLRLECAIRS